MPAFTRTQVFSAVHTVGGLIPADMLLRIANGKDVKGSQPADYGVVGARSVRDIAERQWDYLKSIWRELRLKLPTAPEAEPRLCRLCDLEACGRSHGHCPVVRDTNS